MITVPELNGRMARYLSGEVSLNQFNEWLAETTWNVTQQQPGSQAQKLVGAIEMALAEYSDRKLSLDELRKRFSDLLSAGDPMLPARA